MRHPDKENALLESLIAPKCVVLAVWTVRGNRMTVETAQGKPEVNNGAENRRQNPSPEPSPPLYIPRAPPAPAPFHRTRGESNQRAEMPQK